MMIQQRNFLGSSSLWNAWMHQKSEGDHRAVTGSPSPLFVQQQKVQAEDIPRSLFSFSPHDLDRGGAHEEVIWKELEEASTTLEEVMNNHKHVCCKHV
jgi:hypothetical protein